MIATSGDELLDPAAIATYERELFPLATVITPNLHEAARLLGQDITDVALMRRAATALAMKYRAAVLIKGAHLRGPRAIDVLSDGKDLREFSAAFIPNVKTHGTGCTYSAAITAGLARSLSLPEAIATAKRFVSAAIRSRHVWRTSSRKIVALNIAPGH